MADLLSRSAQRVQDALNSFGCELVVTELADSTRTSEEAARAIGCSVGQIAKTLVFMGKSSGKPVLVIASGTNRINEKAFRDYLGEKLEKPDAAFVQEHTGFVIGGIPPIGLKNPIVTFIDQDLMQYQEIWAAAGTPHAVFRLTPELLVRITGGRIVSVK